VKKVILLYVECNVKMANGFTFVGIIRNLLDFNREYFH